MLRNLMASLLILLLSATPLLADSAEAPPRVKLETSMGDIILFGIFGVGHPEPVVGAHLPVDEEAEGVHQRTGRFQLLQDRL